jgi:hypothetical protein
MENAWRSFRGWPGWVQFIAWVIAWPLLGALFFWRSGQPYSKVAAVLILIGGVALYAAAGGSVSPTPVAEPTPSYTPTQAQSLAPGIESIPTSTPTVSSPSALSAVPGRRVSSACRSGDPLANVYHSYRLIVVSRCKTVTGVVKIIRNEDDGDVHFDLKLDAKYANLINDRNRTDQHGYLVAEIVPADEPGCTAGRPPRPSTGTYDYGTCTGANIATPPLGAHVSITGPYVIDMKHGGWMEIHPVWRVVILSGGTPTSTTNATSLRIVSLSPNPVNPGQNITLVAQTTARASCSIKVTYASGHVSTAAGLEPTTASSSGRVSWTWKVGTSTGAGTATAAVTCGSKTATTTFRVT